jgi:uncharacterized protein (TIGR00661 family)
MVKTIAYYISEYGYGHATRSIAIIRKILTRDSSVKIIICHSFAMDFIKRSLNSDRVQFRDIKTDIGYFLKNNSIEPDAKRMTSEYKHFIREMDKMIEQEEKFLLSHQIDLVISDISPLPFGAANHLQIPSIGISNFTWYTAYQGIIDEELLGVFRDSYQKMNYFFALAGSNEMVSEKTKVFHYGFFSREIEPAEVRRITKEINPDQNKKVVFVGLGMKIGDLKLEDLPLWDSDNTVFIVSSNVQINRENVFKIPEEYTESQNYVAASNLIISKAGWGIIGEAIVNHVPFLIIERQSMKEDQNTINYVNEVYNSNKISWEQFRDFTIKDLNFYDQDRRETETINSSEKIAERIVKILHSK